MINDLVFHLGDCKTGTTSIQYALANENWKSSESSILYTARVNHIPLARTLSEKSHEKKQAAKFQKLNSELLKSDRDHAVVSAEHFEFTDPKDLGNAISKYLPEFADKTRFIAYVRPHADRLVSTFAERTKKGNYYGTLTGMHDRLKKDGLLLYTPRFEKWRAEFGDRFTVKPMIRKSLYKQDVVEDFFNYVFDGQNYKLEGDGDANSSLLLEDLAMLRAIQRRIRKSNPELVGPQKALGWNFAPILAKHTNGNGTKPKLHKELAQAVVETYRDDAANLDKEFFVGTPMTDSLNEAVDIAVEDEQSLKLTAHFKRKDIRNMLAFGDLLQHIMEADPTFFMYATRPEDQRRVLKNWPFSE